jgi:nucleotide-binding universal stress UspA family protein
MNLSEKNLILVAFDRSKESEKALEHAIDIADPDDEIQILMVIPKPESDLFYNLDDYNYASLNNIEDDLNDVLKIYTNNGKNITTLIAQGNIIDEILKASENPRCKLIVLGFKGISNIGSFKLGSVSGEVAKRAKVPVLIVR